MNGGMEGRKIGRTGGRIRGWKEKRMEGNGRIEGWKDEKIVRLYERMERMKELNVFLMETWKNGRVDRIPTNQPIIGLF